ncbi:hypothetical protein KY329_03850 [Candidatus Woesearchaeota archaeon]|nr:hypothetical protein [Candidatus Woesearchaeota archaeon]
MAAIGVQFDKVVVDRLKPLEGKVSVNNNSKITNVKKIDIPLGKAKRPALKFDFEYTVDYAPGIAKITIQGFVTALDKPEVIDEEDKKWKKDKKVSPELMTEVLNHILARGSISALILSRELGLPAPIELPKVRVK